MANFQIDNNRKKRFFALLQTGRLNLTDDDYREAADALIRNADEYYVFIRRASNGNLNCVLDVIFPFLSGCGFVCELYLKALLCKEKKDFFTLLDNKNRHSLKELFNSLSTDTKEQIKARFPYRNDTKENFELCLSENAQVYYELRYANEYMELAGDCYFIPDLMVTLRNVAD